ncbi:MAG: bifunctional oligoribonuclease/PAP phosphatase NrnA [Bacilli bacterium]|nr:bifunctional oligoribonuclease/PAP phosphatase NrnA [Bacilli bacterium]
MENLKLKQSILERIKAYDSIIISRHIKPDGDCMGSSIGLREILRTSFPDKKVYSLGRMKADYLDFIGSEDKEVEEDTYRKSLLIVVDTATYERIDNKYYSLCPEIIKIDHHIPQDDYGDINYVRVDLPATCAIIVDFYNTFKDELIITEEAAKALFVGIVTDTGRFRYSGVSSDFMKLTAILLEHNLNLENIYANLYIRDKETLKLQGYVLKHFKTTENGVAYFNMSKRVRNKHKVAVEDASALVNMLDSIRGHLIWLFFIEAEDGTWRVRIRSRFVAINELAEKYSGGGHRQAAGALVKNRREKKELILEADKLLEQYKKENQGAF